MGSSRSAKIESGARVMLASSPAATIARGRRAPKKTAAASNPSAPAKTTEPDPPSSGITTATDAQPRPAPARSAAYRRFTSAVSRDSRSAIASPAKKKGTAIVR